MNSLEIASLVNGKHIGKSIEVNGFCIDSRRIKPNQAFIAIKGERFDGHSFINDAQKAGATLAIVQEQTKSDITQIVVKDTKEALFNLAKTKRDSFRGKVIAIAGSAGKTTTKELVAFLLSKTFRVCKTPGNFNSQIGVPLSIINFPQCDIWVLELGASKPKELKRLIELSRPEIRVLTAIGEEHLETFGGFEGVISSTSELFEGMRENHVAVLPKEALCYFSPARRAVFSFDELKNLTMGDDGVKASLGASEIALPIASLGLLKSALGALKVLEVIGLNWQKYCQSLIEFEPPEGRFRPLRWGNWLLIDDTYNANPLSVQNALESLRYFSGQRLAVLGDMLELGEYSERLHRQIGEMCAKYGIECWFFGYWMQKAYEECVKAKGNCFRLESEEKLKKRLSEGNGVIIFKGSRGIKMERFINLIKEG